jgi:hypothetical protein
MKSHFSLRFVLTLTMCLVPGGADLGQVNPPAEKAVVVNGKTVVATGVRQIDGHAYVDIEALAQAINGVVTIEPSRVVLTIPVSAPAAITGPPTTVAVTQLPQGLSKDFSREAIAEVAEMREWRGAVGTMVTYGLAVSGSWTQDYHDRVDEGLREATVAASTDDDRSAAQLLKNEFDALAAWSTDIITARQNLNAAKTIDPNALQNDPALAKITACSRFLNGMLVSGVFSDDGSCH